MVPQFRSSEASWVGTKDLGGKFPCPLRSWLVTLTGAFFPTAVAKANESGENGCSTGERAGYLLVVGMGRYWTKKKN